MTDLELIKAAAKAAGYPPAWRGPVMVWTEGGVWRLWNPLTDDGDALRLAVTLGIQSGYSEFSGSGFASWDRGSRSVSEYGPDDPCAATRRAITRAAAEIGKAAP